MTGFSIDEHTCYAAHAINDLGSDYVQFILVTVFFGSALPVRYRPVSQVVPVLGIRHEDRGTEVKLHDIIFGITMEWT
jgi:hypothetical protein